MDRIIIICLYILQKVHMTSLFISQLSVKFFLKGMRSLIAHVCIKLYTLFFELYPQLQCFKFTSCRFDVLVNSGHRFFKKLFHRTPGAKERGGIRPLSSFTQRFIYLSLFSQYGPAPHQPDSERSISQTSPLSFQRQLRKIPFHLPQI